MGEVSVARYGREELFRFRDRGFGKGLNAVSFRYPNPDISASAELALSSEIYLDDGMLVRQSDFN